MSIDESAFYEMSAFCSAVSERLSDGPMPESQLRNRAMLFVQSLRYVQRIIREQATVQFSVADVMTMERDMPVLQRLYGDSTYERFCAERLDTVLDAVADGGRYMPMAEEFFRDFAEAYSDAASFLKQD